MKKEKRNEPKRRESGATNVKTTTCDASGATRNRLISLIVAATVAFVFFFFLSRPFNETTPRWVLFLMPFAENFLDVVWFGVDLPKAPYGGERLAALALGTLEFLAALGLGRFLFALLNRYFKPFNANRSEAFFFSAGIGLTAISASFYLVAGTGKFATIFLTLLCVALGFASFRVRPATKTAETPPVPALRLPFKTRFDKALTTSQLLLLTLFSSFYVFAATQPIFEYDALEYHLQGAREIFETGAATFSSTNVYANMPLGSEIAYYWGFRLAELFAATPENVLRFGALAGKTVVCSFALLTALGLFAFCVRFLRDVRAGLFAALLFLSFPRTFDVYSNGLNDGVLGFALLSVFYLLALTFAKSKNAARSSSFPFLIKSRIGLSILIGVFVGFAVSIKYTGVVFVAAPTFVALLAALIAAKPAKRSDATTSATEQTNAPNETPIKNPAENFYCDNAADAPEISSRTSVETAPENSSRTFVKIIAPLLIFVATAALIGGYWYVRNFAATGNPVYPLAFNVFGDSTDAWNADVDARWRRAHSASDQSAAALADSISRPGWRDDLASPFSPFVPIAGIATLYAAFRLIRKRRENAEKFALPLAVVATIFVFWLGWHFATHRLTRFLVPISPLSALLLGAVSSRNLTRKDADDANANPFNVNILAQTTILVVLAFGLCWSGLEIDLRGQGRLAPLRALERDAARFPRAAIYFNDRPELFDAPTQTERSEQVAPTEKRALLLVGEAKAFAYRVPVRYSTCWNDSPLIPLLDGAVKRNASGKIVAVVDAAKIRDNFRRAKIAFVLVDFAELARFRSPGNYGFNDAEIDENLFRLLENADVLERFSPPELQPKSDGANATNRETTKTYLVN